MESKKTETVIHVFEKTLNQYIATEKSPLITALDVYCIAQKFIPLTR